MPAGLKQSVCGLAEADLHARGSTGSHPGCTACFHTLEQSYRWRGHVPIDYASRSSTKGQDAVQSGMLAHWVSHGLLHFHANSAERTHAQGILLDHPGSHDAER